MQLTTMQDVLIVDDSHLHRQLASELCSQLGFTHIRHAVNGEEGMALVRQQLPDLILLDLEMPRMDGVQVMQQLALEKLAPYIILTSGKDYILISTLELMGSGLGLPVLGGLKKPLQAGELQDLLARLSTQAAHGKESYALCDAADIRQALEQQQIIPHYQPKVDLGSGQLKGVEMLARWRHPGGGLIMPGSFIPVIEQYGWATELTLTMLEQGLQQWQDWARQGLRLPLSINLSARSLQGSTLISEMESRLQRSRVPARYITFEITETAIADNLSEAIGMAARLRLAGFGLSIDDFGTGFATLQQLTRFPFTELKIDQSLVTAIGHKPHLQAITNSIIELGQRMQLTTVAEGIETQQDMELMQTRGCNLGQGYFIARPMEAAQLQPWAKQRQQLAGAMPPAIS
ncbi:EAL domain-containing response regulator [Aquitalea magnusonii]|uniref:EAL domain-containing protein (Putative c-di-GMP-specific phosphodiesterase class I) n=1 Tax=Aquitalea magnusonii TaxID=332411 RepID=A0A318JKH2_9NEIS|nr:EAL domain-containing response regulator [Aquitalea magnusonii]PXX48036.1 EAL domain-containing protein (putative c-di-GMP-specific phosphodiesterase class I) [Aquitalea magnusonii]